VSTAIDELAAERRVPERHGANLVEDLWGKEWVVDRADEECGNPNAIEPAEGARAVVVIGGVDEAMYRSGDRVVEIPH
jgi:hypothetical protein